MLSQFMPNILTGFVLSIRCYDQQLLGDCNIVLKEKMRISRNEVSVGLFYLDYSCIWSPIAVPLPPAHTSVREDSGRGGTAFVLRKGN